MFEMLVHECEPMQVDRLVEHNGNTPRKEPIVTNNPGIDLEAYANSYTGLAKILRLMYIADHCPSLCIEALKIAITCVMDTYNVELYSTLHRKLTGAVSLLEDERLLQDLPTYDKEWVNTRSKTGALILEKYDSDLKNYKTNSIKESIRRGHDDLGDHYLDCGDVKNAIKCYSRSRDYCTSTKQVIEMSWNVLKMSIYLENWPHVISHVNKTASTPNFPNICGKEYNLGLTTKFNVASGLAQLATGVYKPAAKLFIQTSVDYCNLPEIVSPANVAIYGGLCALATFDRHELEELVISNSSFKLFLELEPQCRDIILNFYESKYETCLKMLEDIKDNLLLDMYIAQHVDKLYKKIRNQALIQYFSPYLNADMVGMAATFNTSVAALEEELMLLILDGSIQARIDSHNKILYARHTDQRRSTFEKSLALAKEYKRRTEITILRATIVKSKIVVKFKEVPQDKDYYVRSNIRQLDKFMNQIKN